MGEIGKWLSRDTLYGTDWSRNIYFSVMMECMGKGVFVCEEKFGGFGGSVIGFISLLMRSE